MGKKRKSKEAADSGPQPSRPFHSAFEGLEALRAHLPEGEAEEPEAATTEPLSADTPSQGRLTGNLIVRHERKGRGGKTVTLLLGLRCSAELREELARELGRALGCAARLEGEQVVLGGDLRSRLEQWLRERGANVRQG